MTSKSMLNKVSFSVAAALMFAVLAVSLSARVGAQAMPQLTAEQQQMLQTLPPAQRDALLRRYVGQQRESGRQQPAAEVRAQPEEVGTESVDEQQSLFPRLEPKSTVILVLKARGAGDDEIEAFRDRINEDNPFRLDRSGRLVLPGVPAIELAGLSESQARLRLQAQPELADFDLQFYLLPVERQDGDSLMPFGYDLFATDGERFSVNESLPVPRNYAVGPGDTVYLQFYGTLNALHTVPIDRDGMLNLPELGPLQASGLTFDALRDEIRLRARERLIGTDVSVTLGDLRSVRVFLVGDVAKPGAYQVSPYATITNVLAIGGGVAETGSLRDIQLRRGGKKVAASLDLYSLLLRGDASQDARVSDGDVVFVPPVGPRVAVYGEVRRPAIYEFRGSTSVAQALEFAGGSLPGALVSRVSVERPNPETGLDVLNVDLGDAGQAGLRVRAGDRIVVAGDTEQIDEAVTLSGHVQRPGMRQWRQGQRLSGVLASSQDLMPNADAHYVLIKRQVKPNGLVTVLSADLEAIWAGSPHANDPVLFARDEIIVFPRDVERSVFLDPILDQLAVQSAADAPTAVVRVDGQVKHPGVYPLEAGMTLADLVRAGGGLTESAYLNSAELTRYDNDAAGRRTLELTRVSLEDVDGLSGLSTILLQPFDLLSVKEIPNWGTESYVEIRGDVAFPGRYTVARGETLSSVLERAGGLNATSFPAGSVFTRVDLAERERELIENLAARVENDLATLALSNPNQVDAISIGQSLLAQMRSTEPTGRLVIDMDAIVSGEPGADVLVRDGDRLMVPQRSQEVTVIGEVQYATSHMWRSGLSREEYIVRSGGLTVKADSKRIYIVRASGEVVVSKRSRFYAKGGGNEIRAGDTIVVPLKTDRVAPLVLWSSATQILYNLAIAAAAVNSF